MFRVLCLLVFAVFCGVNSQDCVPEPIAELRLSRNNSTLTWQPSSNCDNTIYLIYLLQDGALEHMYQVHETFLDVSFLRACEPYRFVVMAVADTAVGTERHLDAIIPAAPGTNLTVSRLHVTQQGVDAVLLEWELEDKVAPCVEYYRVVHWDGETAPLDTYTTYNNVVLDNLAPCTQFQFTVTPIYNTDLEGGIGLLTYNTPPHNAHFPSIVRITPGVTYADMIWRLPLYSTNRCPIETFVLDASPYVNLTIPVHDDPGRPPISVRAAPLQPDRMYLFRVTMVNSGGPSTPIQIAIQTLPENVD